MKHERIQVIDSHTGGEPTRIIVAGGPDLGGGKFSQRVARFREQFDDIRSAVVNEPRGSDVIVGGLLTPPLDEGSAAGVIFFNNTGYLGMCGHGTIGLMVTLKHLGLIEDGAHVIETLVGKVTATLLPDDEANYGRVSVQNVPSFRLAANVEVEVEGVGKVVGDVAWGGNWFFLVKNFAELNVDSQWSLERKHANALTQFSLQIRNALEAHGITGTDGAWIDHVELFGPPASAGNDSRNFVLCPGGAYDRSPCGTGTSAKLACLAADGKLAAGQVWRQESVVGSVFAGSYAVLETIDDQTQQLLGAATCPVIIPTITGSAFVCSEATLILNPHDPLCIGIQS